MVKMAKTVNLYEAKTKLSRLVEQAADGEEIIIAKAGRPRARLVSMGRPGKPRKAGAWKGRVVIAANFDAPLPKSLLAAFRSGGK